MARVKSGIEYVPVSVLLPRDVLDAVEAAARADSRSRSNYIATVLARVMRQNAQMQTEAAAEKVEAPKTDNQQ